KRKFQARTNKTIIINEKNLVNSPSSFFANYEFILLSEVFFPFFISSPIIIKSYFGNSGFSRFACLTFGLRNAPAISACLKSFALCTSFALYICLFFVGWYCVFLIIIDNPFFLRLSVYEGYTRNRNF